MQQHLQPQASSLAATLHLRRLLSDGTYENAGYALERFAFLTSNREERFAGINRHPKSTQSGTIAGAKNVPHNWMAVNGGGMFRPKAQAEPAGVGVRSGQPREAEHHHEQGDQGRRQAEGLEQDIGQDRAGASQDIPGNGACRRVEAGVRDLPGDERRRQGRPRIRDALAGGVQAHVARAGDAAVQPHAHA